MLISIIGTTNHSLFSLPVKGEFKPLSSALLKKKQLEFRDKSCVVLEEYACTSQVMLGWINKRCQEFKNNSLSFGGMSVFMVGDPSQLPPVAGVQMFDRGNGTANSLQGYLCYQEFKKVFSILLIRLKVVILTEKHRQQNINNDPEQEKFISLLASLADGVVSLQQWTWLMETRTPRALGSQELSRFQKDAHYLCSTNSLVNSRNLEKITSLDKPIFKIAAKNTPTRARGMSSDHFRGIENTSFYSIESKISFTTNICKEFGLVNGAPGVIRDVVWGSEKTPNIDLPEFVIIEVPSYTGPSFFPEAEEERRNWIPVSPCTFSDDSFALSRTGLPIRLAYAMTIHKAQGESLSPIHCNIGINHSIS